MAKTAWFLGVCVAAVAALAACGGGDSGAQAPGPARPDTTVGGVVNGLAAGGTLVVGNMDAGGQLLQSTSLKLNGVYALGMKAGTPYDIRIVTQPAGQTCKVGNATGTATAPVDDISIVCTTNFTAVTLSGDLSGLAAGQQLGLAREATAGDTAEELTLTANGAFHFTRPVAGAYRLTVRTQPQGRACTITNGAGIAAMDSGVTVACVAAQVQIQPQPQGNLFIGGVVDGLRSGTSVVLQNNGGDDTELSANGNFAFGARVGSGASYDITVRTMPAGQSCTVSNGQGKVAAGNATSVVVHCTGVTTVVARLRGLPAGTSVVLRNNGADDLTLDANGDYPFSSRLAASATYDVTIMTQPEVGSCAPLKGSGITGNGGTVTVVVDCIAGPANSSTIGVQLLRLPAGKSVVLQNNGGNDLQLGVNGSYAFSGRVNAGAAYDVTVKTQPGGGVVCVVTDGSGVAPAAGTVITTFVPCQAGVFTLGGAVAGVAAGAKVTLENANTLEQIKQGDGPFTLILKENVGGQYLVYVVQSPPGQTCTVNNGAGVVAANVANIAVVCTTP